MIHKLYLITIDSLEDETHYFVSREGSTANFSTDVTEAKLFSDKSKVESMCTTLNIGCDIVCKIVTMVNKSDIMKVIIE